MLHLARATGTRPIEIGRVTVDDITKAYETGILSIAVAKNKKNKIRDIPVLKSRLAPITDFINGTRKNFVDKVLNGTDPGYLFLSVQGKKVSTATLTNEMNDIARLAGLEINVCLYMFRHRYFTDMAYNFLLGIKEFVVKRELTAPSERLVLQQMRSLSQHENDQTLLGYIHNAYKEASAWDLGERLWNISQIHESMVLAVQEIMEMLDAKMVTGEEIMNRLMTSLKQWGEELQESQIERQEYESKLI